MTVIASKAVITTRTGRKVNSQSLSWTFAAFFHPNCCDTETHGRQLALCNVKTLRLIHERLITLYTKEHTKSMKPHCILGSCSAQFLSIMGCERKEGREGAEREGESERDE